MKLRTEFFSFRNRWQTSGDARPCRCLYQQHGPAAEEKGGTTWPPGLTLLERVTRRAGRYDPDLPADIMSNGNNILLIITNENLKTILKNSHSRRSSTIPGKVCKQIDKFRRERRFP